MTGPSIQAVAVTKCFTRGGKVVRAVDDVDLTLAAGELVAVTGPSLSGKTTLIELLAGWRHPDRGSIAWNGGATTPPPWSSLTVVPQALALLEEITVLENICLAHRIAPRPETERDDRLTDLLGQLGLDHLRHRGAHEISIGERQRAMVARALLDRPDTVLADEPVAHQDQHHADIVLRLLREAVDQGAAGVVATRQPEVAQIADRVLTLRIPEPS